MVVAPALRYHGAKFRLAPWILQFVPPHRCYVEPFGGAAGILLRKPRSFAEVYNDLDGDVVNFFRVLRDPAQCAELIRICTLTPYARDEFESAYAPTDDPVERARQMAIRAAMGFGGSGSAGSTGFRIGQSRKYVTAQHLWARYPDCLSAVADRFRGVLIENRPALDVLRQHDGPETLHYVDPPYLPETRNSGRCYRHEMTVEQHVELLGALDSLAGMVVLSGYPSELYDTRLAGWCRHTTMARMSSGRGTGLREEVVWINRACELGLHDVPGGLFAQPEKTARTGRAEGAHGAPQGEADPCSLPHPSPRPS